jgi:hypothetical protein
MMKQGIAITPFLLVFVQVVGVAKMIGKHMMIVKVKECVYVILVSGD